MIGMKNLTSLERESILKDSCGKYQDGSTQKLSGIHFLPMKGKDWLRLSSMNWKQMSFKTEHAIRRLFTTVPSGYVAKPKPIL